MLIDLSILELQILTNVLDKFNLDYGSLTISRTDKEEKFWDDFHTLDIKISESISDYIRSLEN